MKVRHLAGALALATAASVSLAQAQDAYTIDKAHTQVGFKVKHLMISDVRGTFDEFEGTITIDPAKMENSAVDVTIQTASINTRNEKRDGHLKSADFFDAANHPTITFKSKKVMKKGEQWVAVGDLTMRGVTREIELPFTVAGPITNGYGKSVIAVAAGTEVNRMDFGVKWQNPLQNGGVVVSETVRIELEVEAVK